MENHDRLEELTLHSHELQKTTEQLVTELADDRRQVKRDRRMYLVFIAVLVLLMGGQLVVTLVNRDTNKTIKSCVEPSGECYQRSKESQARLVGEPEGPLNTVAVAAAACGAAYPGDVEKTLACTKEALANLQAQQP